jgi:hypothetical protein
MNVSRARSIAARSFRSLRHGVIGGLPAWVEACDAVARTGGGLLAYERSPNFSIR